MPLLNFLEAIAREEGFYVAGTRAQRNHNPGNIEWGEFARAHGAIEGDPRFAVFPDDEMGFACMRALMLGAYRGLTVAQAIAKWAPPNENDTQSYITNVCHWTGLTPDTIINTHLGGNDAITQG
jgi:hypothetical protein